MPLRKYTTNYAQRLKLYSEVLHELEINNIYWIILKK